MEPKPTQTTQLHEDKFFKVFWDGSTRIIGIDWKEGGSAMTDEEFKTELRLFAGLVEEKKARGILVDVKSFRHRPGRTYSRGGCRTSRIGTTLPE